MKEIQFGYVTATNTFRIKRTFDYIGNDEARINIDVLQQLWLDNAGNGMWEDVSIVETDDDFYYG